jgi:hypothetical protein
MALNKEGCDDVSMREFFTTSAQVLPTLLIAYIIEMGVLTNYGARHIAKSIEEWSSPEKLSTVPLFFINDVFADLKRSAQYQLKQGAALCLLLAGGECCAVCALLFEAGGVIAWVLAAFCAGAICISMVALVIIPTARIRWEFKNVMMENETALRKLLAAKRAMGGAED